MSSLLSRPRPGWLKKGSLEHIGVEKMAEDLGLPDHNALLIPDSFKAHKTDKIMKMMDKHGTTHCVVLEAALPSLMCPSTNPYSKS